MGHFLSRVLAQRKYVKDFGSKQLPKLHSKLGTVVLTFINIVAKWWQCFLVTLLKQSRWRIWSFASYSHMVPDKKSSICLVFWYLKLLCLLLKVICLKVFNKYFTNDAKERDPSFIQQHFVLGSLGKLKDVFLVRENYNSFRIKLMFGPRRYPNKYL